MKKRYRQKLISSTEKALKNYHKSRYELILSICKVLTYRDGKSEIEHLKLLKKTTGLPIKDLRRDLHPINTTLSVYEHIANYIKYTNYVKYIESKNQMKGPE